MNNTTPEYISLLCGCTTFGYIIFVTILFYFLLIRQGIERNLFFGGWCFLFYFIMFVAIYYMQSNLTKVLAPTTIRSLSAVASPIKEVLPWTLEMLLYFAAEMIGTRDIYVMVGILPIIIIITTILFYFLLIRRGIERDLFFCGWCFLFYYIMFVVVFILQVIFVHVFFPQALLNRVGVYIMATEVVAMAVAVAVLTSIHFYFRPFRRVFERKNAFEFFTFFYGCFLSYYIMFVVIYSMNNTTPPCIFPNWFGCITFGYISLVTAVLAVSYITSEETKDKTSDATAVSSKEVEKKAVDRAMLLGRDDDNEEEGKNDVSYAKDCVVDAVVNISSIIIILVPFILFRQAPGQNNALEYILWYLDYNLLYLATSGFIMFCSEKIVANFIVMGFIPFLTAPFHQGSEENIAREYIFLCCGCCIFGYIIRIVKLAMPFTLSRKSTSNSTSTTSSNGNDNSNGRSSASSLTITRPSVAAGVDTRVEGSTQNPAVMNDASAEVTSPAGSSSDDSAESVTHLATTMSGIPDVSTNVHPKPASTGIPTGTGIPTDIPTGLPASLGATTTNTLSSVPNPVLGGGPPQDTAEDGYGADKEDYVDDNEFDGEATLHHNETVPSDGSVQSEWNPRINRSSPAESNSDSDFTLAQSNRDPFNDQTSTPQLGMTPCSPRNARAASLATVHENVPNYARLNPSSNTVGSEDVSIATLHSGIIGIQSMERNTIIIGIESMERNTTGILFSSEDDRTNHLPEVSQNVRVRRSNSYDSLDTQSTEPSVLNAAYGPSFSRYP